MGIASYTTHFFRKSKKSKSEGVGVNGTLETRFAKNRLIDLSGSTCIEWFIVCIPQSKDWSPHIVNFGPDNT